MWLPLTPLLDRYGLECLDLPAYFPGREVQQIGVAHSVAANLKPVRLQFPDLGPREALLTSKPP